MNVVGAHSAVPWEGVVSGRGFEATAVGSRPGLRTQISNALFMLSAGSAVPAPSVTGEFEIHATSRVVETAPPPATPQPDESAQQTREPRPKSVSSSEPPSMTVAQVSEVLEVKIRSALLAE